MKRKKEENMSMATKIKKSGFTLLEVIVVIIILAILAAIAVPRYTQAQEKAKAAEGTYFLGTLLSSMERYYLEKGIFPNGTMDSSSNLGLDIDMPTLKHFYSIANITDTCSSTSSCAEIRRDGSTYRLNINRTGTISCTQIVPGANPTCQQAGY